MGPQDPKDVARDTARDLSGLAGELAALKAGAHHWLTSPEYAVPPPTPRKRGRGGRGSADRGQAQGKDERGAAWRLASRYLHKHPTSDNTDRPERGLGRPSAIGTGYYVVLSRILQVNFREFLFHALR